MKADTVYKRNIIFNASARDGNLKKNEGSLLNSEGTAKIDDSNIFLLIIPERDAEGDETTLSVQVIISHFRSFP